MRIVKCDQYDPRWWEARRGIPTASEFHRIMTPKQCKLAAAHDGYINSLIGDLLDGEYPRRDDSQTGAMARGSRMEPRARRMYEYDAGQDVELVGFCVSDDGRFGCSPDALVGDDGLLEIKNPTAGVHVGWARAGTLPDDYLCQAHGQLIVTGRKWLDFCSYLPNQPLFIVRVVPDSFTDKLRACLEEFWGRYQAALSLFRPVAERSAA